MDGGTCDIPFGDIDSGGIGRIGGVKQFVLGANGMVLCSCDIYFNNLHKKFKASVVSLFICKFLFR